ncbi:MAG: ferrous iron transport protein B, partial [Candidatus Dadabacteria bacterium]
ELKALGLPMIIAINMIDLAHSEGISVDIDHLQQQLNAPVLAVSARKGTGIAELRHELARLAAGPAIEVDGELQTAFLAAANERRPDLVPAPRTPVRQSWRELRAQASELAARLGREAIRRDTAPRLRNLSARIDDVTLHPVWGLVTFLGLMALIFQSVYAWSEPLIGWIEAGIDAFAALLTPLIGGSMLGDLLLDAGLYGAGNVLVFLPQILILFLWIALLEESGYLARVAFLVDRPMRAAGLSGKSFIPLLSSYACAVPGIMAARTIEHAPTRLVTVLVAPLMTCSARLPVYALLIGAFVPKMTVAGVFNAQGLVLFALYALGVLGALLLARLISRRVERGIPVPMILELPIYRWPDWKNVALTLRDRAWIFVRRAGTVIFGMSILLWFGLNFPRDLPNERMLRANGASDDIVMGYRLEHSAVGRAGKLLEPVVAPLGYDWKIGVSLIASFAAREVMVATLGTIYNLGETDEESISLRDALRADPTWDLATALSVLVFYVFALQCMSTVAVMKRETGGWRWPLRALGITYGIAWVAAFATYHLVRVLTA